MSDWQPRAKHLADLLAAAGMLTDPRWRDAFESTPRHLFAPRFWALDGYNAPTRLVDGANPDQHTEWLDTVYADRMLATQWTPDTHDRLMITSSASQPTLVAHMLHLLDVHDGDRVLEIGTGTGYNTALLCHRLGQDRVVSIDIDPVLVAEATTRLTALGLQPTVTVCDGGHGLADRAPYHRILSTCASPGVPAAWIDQLAGGGTIVAPLTIGGALAVLTKTGPGEVSGHFDREPAYFMPLRALRDVPGPDLVDLPDLPPPEQQHRGTVDLDSAAFDDPDFRLWLNLHLPDGQIAGSYTDDLTRQTGVIVYTAAHRADIGFPDTTGQPCTAVQDERRLADTVEAAWHAWQRYGRPLRTRLGITAHTDGPQHAWLDGPTGLYSWPVPGVTAAPR